MSLHNKHLIPVVLSTYTLITSVSPGVSAQSGILEEIVVTARMRSENLQDVPVSVRAFNEVAIEEAGITSMRDYVGLTPNIALQETQNTGFAFVNIRGLSTQRNTDQAVAVSVDGVLTTNSLIFSQEMFDIEQIEILKGPQGALYGRNSAGGAINITTKQPTNELEGMVRAGMGNGDAFKISGMLSGPVVEDKVLYRAAFSFQDSDGTRDNITTGIEVDPYDELAFRGKLLFTPNENTTMDFRFSFSDSQAGSTQFISNAPVAVDLPGFVTGPLGTGAAGIPDNGSTAFNSKALNAPFGSVAAIIGSTNNLSVQNWGNQPGEDNRESYAVSAKIDYRNDYGTFTSITSWDKITHLTEGEQLFYLPLVPAQGLNAINAQNRYGDAISQEFRFTSPEDMRFRWIAGAYLVQTDLDVYYAILDDLDLGIDSIGRNPNTRANPTSPTKLFAAQFAGASGGIPAPITNPADALSFLGDTNDNFAYALFGQAGYDITDEIELSLALRYDNDDREQTTDVDQQFLPQYQDPVTLALSGPVSGEVRNRNYDSLQPKATIRWQPNDNLTLYGIYSKGFRSGGFNPSGTAQAIRVMANAGVVGLPAGVRNSFEKEESDSIEGGLKARLLDGNLIINTAAFYTSLDNAFTFFFVGPIAAQTIRNIDESEIIGFEIDAAWRVNDNLSLDAAFGMIDSEIEASSFLGVGGINIIGNELPLNPESTLNLGATYRKTLTDEITGFLRFDYERIGEMFFSIENWEAREPLNLVNIRGGIKVVESWELTAWVRNTLDENYFTELFNPFGIGYYGRERRFGGEVTYRF